MKRYQFILVLALFYVLQIIFCKPFVDFPMGDDWSYAKAVKNLVEEGRLQYTGWTSMPLIVQVLWGSLFTLPFGFSHGALRLSTIVLAFAGGCGTFALAGKMTNGRQTASFIVTLLMVVNPYYNQMAFGFSTDIPFFAFFIWAVYFLVMYLEDGYLKYFVFAAIFLLLATLIRDITIVTPVALGIALCIKKGIGIKQLVKPVLLLLLVIATICLWRYYLQSAQELPALYDFAKTRLLSSARQGFLKFLVIALQWFVLAVYILSVALLPCTILRMPEVIKTFRRKYVLAAVIGIAGASTGLLLLSPRLVNIFSTNILLFLYCGEIDYVQQRTTPGTIAPGFSPVVDMIAFYVATLSVVLAGCSFTGIAKGGFGIQRIKQLRPSVIFCIVFIILYLVLVSPGGIYPRYLIPLIPLASVLLLYDLNFAILPGKYKKIFVLLSFIYIYAGVAAAYDILQIYRARATALSHLTDRMKVPPQKIDGGFEFNGWHFYDPKAVAKPGKNWWWVVEDEYIVASSELKYYTTIYKVPYTRLLPMGKRWMYVMKKDNPLMK